MASMRCLKTSGALQQGVSRGSTTLLTAPGGMRSPLLSPRCPTPQQRCPASAVAVGSKATFVSAADITYTTAVDTHTAVGTQRHSTYDDAYDSAVPMSVVSGWERVEEDLGIDEGPGADPQEWEEMVSLLSFDGEEHKRVMRQMHGANARVEDMFASFDGDDFEAIMRAARSEIANDPAAANASAQQHASGGDSSGISLYQSVCALRAAAMAAETAKKLTSPALKKRRTPLDDKQSGDAWMLQVPYAVADKQHSSSTTNEAAAADKGASLQPQSQQGLALEGTGAEHVEPVVYSRSSNVNVAQLQLDAKAYVGMSCDSSSDGGHHTSSSRAAQSRGLARAAAAGAAAGTHDASAKLVGARPGVQAAAGAVAALRSNNIVSSRALGSKLSAGQHVIAAAAVQASSMRSAATAAAATAVLELAPVATQLSPRLHVSSQAAATRTTDAQLLQGQQQQGLTEEMSGKPASAAGQGRQRSSSNTRSLRKALARLHSPLAPQ